MRPNRVEAVQDVTLAAQPALADKLRWFYGEVAGLTEVSAGVAPRALRFRAEKIELRIDLVPDAVVDPIPTRMTLRVRSLTDVAALLDDNAIEYTRFSGMGYTDRAIVALDPAGYRVEIRQSWPEAPF